jgi:hypothetical protein
LIGPLGKTYDYLIDTEPLTSNEEAFINSKRKSNIELAPASKKYLEGKPTHTTYSIPIVNAGLDVYLNRCEDLKKEKRNASQG